MGSFTDIKIKDKLKETLDRKIAAYEIVTNWYGLDSQNCKENDIVKDYEKNAIELNAQIKLLRHLLNE